MSILLLLVAPSLAGDLVWRWTPGQAVRYHAESLLTTPASPTYFEPGNGNEDVGASQVEIVLDLSCVGAAKSKGFDVLCDIEKARLGGIATRNEQVSLDRIFAAYGALLEAGSVQITQLTDGRITGVDLEGVPNPNARSSEILNVLRQIVRRAVTPLDLQLPKNGDDDGKPWKQTGSPLAAEAYGATGATGGLKLLNEIGAPQAGRVSIQTSGGGNLMLSRRDIEVGELVNLVVAADGRFDGAAGTLAYRSLSTSMEAIGANVVQLGWDGYKQVGWIARWNADGSLEGPDGPVAPAAPEVPAAPAAPEAAAPPEAAPTPAP